MRIKVKRVPAPATEPESKATDCQHPEYYVDHCDGQWKEFFCAKCMKQLDKGALHGRKNLGTDPR